MLVFFLFANFALIIIINIYRNNLDVLIYIVGIFVVAIFVPYIFYYFLNITNIYLFQVYRILFLNYILFLILIYITYSPSNKLELFSELKFRFKKKNIFKNNYLPGNIRNIILKYSLVFSLYKLLSNAILDFNISRTDIWKEAVISEAASGMGVQGIFSFIFTGFFYLCVYEGLFSKNLSTRKKTLNIFIGYQLVSILQVIFYGLYRSPVIFIFASTIIVYHFYYQSISIRKLKMGLILFVLLLPFYFSYTAYIRDGNLDISTNNISILHGLSGLSTSLEFLDLYERLNEDELSYEYGKQFFYNYISFIPRVIWKDKPYTSFSFRKSTEIYGEVGINSWVHTYTVWGEGYNQFGIVGTILATLQLFFIIFILTSMLSRNPVYSILTLQMFIIKIPILLRGDLSSFFGAFYQIFFTIISYSIFKFVLNIKSNIKSTL